MTNFYKSETPEGRHKKQTTSPTGDVSQKSEINERREDLRAEALLSRSRGKTCEAQLTRGSRRRASTRIFWGNNCNYIYSRLAGWLAARKENRGKALEASPGLTSLFLNPVERQNCAKAKHLSERGHECRSCLGRNRSVEESEAP